MLDQSFSASNFRKILDIENRKGIYLEGDFFTDVAGYSFKLKDFNSELKLLKKKGLSKDDYTLEKEIINEKKELIKTAKEKLLEEKLIALSSKVTSSDFKIEISVDTSISSKPVYKTVYSLENILALKQLQYNFSKLYKVKQTSRYSIVSQLKCLLDDGFPKVILKTDIKEFYESIPQDKLLKKLNDENLLTHLSRKFIKQILIGYNSLSATTKGVPRGIGISAYLVELFMRDFDSKVKALPNVMYYARYVDDIIIIFMPSMETTIRDYQAEIKAIMINDGLTMNEEVSKTKLINLSNPDLNSNYDFDYLGYRFISGYHSGKHLPLKMTISKKKKKKYSIRLINALNLYKIEARRNEKVARKLLILRVRFLMGNTRLINNKKNVLTGIYYANSLINIKDDFKHLDLFFNRLLTKSTLPTPLINRLRLNNSFESGFNPSHVTRFNASQLNLMMKNWTK